MNSSPAIDHLVKEVLHHADEHRRLELPVPTWLQKQIDGLALMQTDWNRGIALVIDGKQDYLDLLDGAERKLDKGQIQFARRMNA